MNEEWETLRSMRRRELIRRVVYVGLIVSVAFSLWRTSCYIANCDAPLVVVLSGSMEPGYRRGDVLFLHHSPRHPVKVGDIVVFKLPSRAIPIVHRVLRIHERQSDGKRFLLTKGDNNLDDDRNLYTIGNDWIEDDQIIGKTFAYVPFAGYVTMAFNECVVVKYAVLALIGFFMLTSWEQ